jgi:DEAD/DEAH box helicase domain-containing protein
VLEFFREILPSQANTPKPGQSESIRSYRGASLPGERREIERVLPHRRILGVVATNALRTFELGIDVGSLDACVMAGYCGSIASIFGQGPAVQEDVLEVRARRQWTSARSVPRGNTPKVMVQ